MTKLSLCKAVIGVTIAAAALVFFGMLAEGGIIG